MESEDGSTSDLWEYPVGQLPRHKDRQVFDLPPRHTSPDASGQS